MGDWDGGQPGFFDGDEDGAVEVLVNGEPQDPARFIGLAPLIPIADGPSQRQGHGRMTGRSEWISGEYDRFHAAAYPQGSKIKTAKGRNRDPLGFPIFAHCNPRGPAQMTSRAVREG